MLKNVFNTTKNIMTLFSFKKKLWLFLFVSVFLALISQICLIINSYIYRYFIDIVIIEQKKEYLIITLMGYSILFIISNIMDYAAYKRNIKISSQAVQKTRNTILGKYLHFDITDEYVEFRKILIDELPLIYEFIDKVLMVFCVNSLAVIICFAAMINYNLILTLVCMVTIPITYYLNQVVLKGESDANKIIRDNDKDTEKFLANIIENSDQVKILDYELKNTKEIFDIYKEKNLWLQLKYAVYNITRFRVMPLIKNELIMQLLVYIVGGILIMADQIALGTLLGFTVLFNLFQKNLNLVFQACMDIQANAVHYSAIIDNYNSSDNSQDGIVVEKIDSIKFKKFELYIDDKRLFKELNYNICNGDHVFITGRSGIGKSTLLKCILGLHKQFDGDLLINQNSISDIKQSCIYEKIGVVLQTSRLFAGTIKENLLYAKNDATLKDMDNACKRAGLFEYIKSSKEGYDTFVGINGSLMSGGQRQRLLLARVFINDYDIVLLDEPVNALDRDMRQEVLDNLMEYANEKSIIIVSHDIFDCYYDFIFCDLSQFI
ncbi:hypothetical protein C0033_10535 [Clostridium sp. chh4-2]|uniref:ATP-binding cassette domain-containing protein n=1 Tax=Clostridium sp. chh4-2 TaxID=2067550 RepID=UPI000CCF0AE6|nr:ABC transporter ATP-binding protein [Clostridium sp. chh4-2]PNV62082.1 hypothetical protein C0033_10535 [Clostridium sp. chh4-2]